MDDLVCENSCDDFGVRRRGKNMAVSFVFVSQFIGIDQVPVVNERQRMSPEHKMERLNVLRFRSAGRWISHMTDTCFPSQTIEDRAAKHLGHETVSFVFMHGLTIIRVDTCALLTPVLEGI